MAAKAAQRFGARKGTVDVWKHRGRLPSRLYPKHTEVIQRMGLLASPVIWGVVVAEKAA